MFLFIKFWMYNFEKKNFFDLGIIIYLIITLTSWSLLFKAKYNQEDKNYAMNIIIILKYYIILWQ